MRPIRKLLLTTAAAALLLATMSPVASGAIIGQLSITSNQEGVMVDAMAIDWTPVGPPDGTFSTAFGTNMTYGAGTPIPISADIGRVLDLVTGGAPVQPGFFLFPTIPALNFTLEALGPGVGDNCAAADTNGESCSVFAGSPFVLTFFNGGTSITLGARGFATDGGPNPSNWSGSFTTQISNMTPLQIQTSFLTNPNFFLSSSYSGVFTATPIPEPGTVALIGGGLIALGIARRRRRV